MTSPPPPYDNVPDAAQYKAPPPVFNTIEPQNKEETEETPEEKLAKHNWRMTGAIGAYCWLTSQSIWICSMAFFNGSFQKWFVTDTARILAYCMIPIFWVPNFTIMMIIWCTKCPKIHRNCIIAGTVFFILTFGALTTFMCGAFHAVGVMFGLVFNLVYQIIMILLYRFTDKKTFTRKKACMIGLVINLVLAGISFIPPYYVDNQNYLGAIPAPVITLFVGFALIMNADRIDDCCSKGPPCFYNYLPVRSCMELAFPFNSVILNAIRFFKIMTNKIE